MNAENNGYIPSENLENIVEEHSDMVYRIALMRTRNRTYADDILGDVFLRLVQYAHTLKNEEHVKAWLIRVTINCTNTYMNKRKRETGYISEDLPSFSQESFNEVYQTVLSLPEKYKTVIHLFYYEDFSIKEISKILQQTESATKMQLKRARTQLKELLEDEQNDRY